MLYIEPYDGGSHAVFSRALTAARWAEWTVMTLPGRHWKWRMRGSGVFFASELQRQGEGRPDERFDLVFASAYLPLAELVGLCPELAAIPRVLYFHENQLTFPTREHGERSRARDLHFGFTQLVSALAASSCVFNSEHNREGFLRAGVDLLRRMPDAVPPDWVARIHARSQVIGLPLDLPRFEADDGFEDRGPRDDGPLIVWNHRWEHDKGPDGLVRLLDGLLARGVRFRLAVCGQQFRRIPRELAEAEPRLREALGRRLVQWGFMRSRAAYVALLRRAQIALSTARHEFFGISMLEAVHCGAYPLVPDALSYPELFPAEHLYEDEDVALERLVDLCEAWRRGDLDLRADRTELTEIHRDEAVLPRYRELFEGLVGRVPIGRAS